MTSYSGFFGPLAAAFLLISSGCTKEADNPKPAPNLAIHPTTYNVALLGDKTRTDLLSAIASANQSTTKTNGNRVVTEVSNGDSIIRFISTSEESVIVHAGLAWEADLVLLAVDATQGPLPVHREHILVSRQSTVPKIVIAFTKSRLIDDPELLELEELEMRELLNRYGFPGDNAPCVFDHPDTKTRPGMAATRGPSQIIQALVGLATKRTPLNAIREEKQYLASVYSLVPQEAFARDVSGPVRNGPTTLFVGSEVVDAEIAVTREITPGESGSIKIAFARPIRVGEGQGFIILHKEHVAATGFFLKDGVGNR